MRISDWSSDVCSSDLPVGKLPSDRELADAVDRMGRMLTVRRAPRAEFIDISVRSRSPDLAAKIANQYVSTLQETRLMERSKKQRKLIKALGAEVDRVHGELAQSEHAVADFRRSHGMLQGAAGPEELAQISRIAAEAASAGSERADLAARSRGIGVAAALQSAATATSPRSEEHTSALQSLMRTSYAV